MGVGSFGGERLRWLSRRRPLLDHRDSVVRSPRARWLPHCPCAQPLHPIALCTIESYPPPAYYLILKGSSFPMNRQAVEVCNANSNKRETEILPVHGSQRSNSHLILKHPMMLTLTQVRPPSPHNSRGLPLASAVLVRAIRYQYGIFVVPQHGLQRCVGVAEMCRGCWSRILVVGQLTTTTQFPAKVHIRPIARPGAGAGGGCGR